MAMSDLKDIIAKNLIRLRQEAGLTQLQLAEMLNYSDKAVSKWERGESIPDLRVLIQLAGLYHIKVDDIISEQPEKVVKPKINLGKKRILVTLLAVGLVWFIATGLFVILHFVPSVEDYAYLVFIVAPFVSAIVLTVFGALWGGRILNAIACSLIPWTLAVMLHVFIAQFAPAVVDKIYLLYIVAVPFQILIILWFTLRKVK
jgi:transcriptional regulator with XRE-family HTH domain